MRGVLAQSTVVGRDLAVTLPGLETTPALVMKTGHTPELVMIFMIRDDPE